MKTQIFVRNIAVILPLFFLIVGCTDSTGRPIGTKDSGVDSDTSADADIDLGHDADSDKDDDSVEDADLVDDADRIEDADPDGDVDVLPDGDIVSCEPASGVDTSELDTCVNEYIDCPCEHGCMDGFSSTLWYSSEHGEFPEGISPPPELLEVAIARYDCSICSCEEGWQIRQGNTWVDGDVCQMCNHILSANADCGDCLVEWWGGCC